MMAKSISPEMMAVEQRRRELSRQKWRQRFAKWSWLFVLAEAFLLPLYPPAATAALLIATVLTVLRFRTDAEFSFRQLPFDVPVGLFVFLSGLSIVVSPDKAFSFYNWYNLVGVYLLTYFVVGQNLRSVRQVKEILAVSAVAAILVLLYGFYQFLFGIDISAMKWVDGEAFPELRKRVFSTWENPNILAGYLDAIICLALGLFLKCGTKQKRIVLGVFMVAAAACLAMTYARGACLVIAVIVGFCGMLKDWRILLACVVIGAVLLVADPVLYERLTSVFTKVDTSSEMRLAFWESTVAMIQDHPFLGIGWGAYWMVYPEYDFYLQGADILIVHAHNFYLNYMAEIGIPGALAFMWLFFGSLAMALGQKFQPPVPAALEPTPFDYNEEVAADVELKKISDSVQAKGLPQELPIWQDFLKWEDYRLLGGLMTGLGLALVSVALNGFTDDLLFNIPTSMFLWMMFALIAALVLLNHPEEEEEAAEEEFPVAAHDEDKVLPEFALMLKDENEPAAQTAAEAVPPAEEQTAAKPEAAQEKASEAAAAAAEKTAEKPAAEIAEETAGEEKNDEESDDHIKGDH